MNSVLTVGSARVRCQVADTKADSIGGSIAASDLSVAWGSSFMISAILRIRFLLAPLAMLAVLAACSAEPLNVPLTFQKNIQLPKDVGSPAIDLLTLDSGAGRLYVPHGSANTLGQSADGPILDDVSSAGGSRLNVIAGGNSASQPKCSWAGFAG